MTAKIDENQHDGTRGGVETRRTVHRLAEWAKAHKKTLVATSLGMAAVAAAVGFGKFGMGKVIHSGLSPMPMSTSGAAGDTVVNAVAATSCTKSPHGVSAHVRNLPAGRSASAAKLAEAAARGIDLKPGQTFVTAYNTGARAV